jgi:hypothetical protein
MILLDTNVISEVFRAQPDAKVSSWLAAVPIEDLFISSVTKAELLYGLALLPDGKRKRDLANVIQDFLEERIENSIVSFDGQAAVAYARIAADRRRAGHVIRELDAQIAAIALACGFAVATRNVSDFEGCGVEIVNPWEQS